MGDDRRFLADRPDLGSLLAELVDQIQQALGDKLAGLYLYGSLIMGDFDPTLSDIDLLAALTSDVEASEFDRLLQMHDAFARRHPAWYDRIEVAYLSLHGLRTFRNSEPSLRRDWALPPLRSC